MEFLYLVLVFLHLLGMAGIISGWLMQIITSHRAAPKAILHSALLQLVSGLLLVTLAETALSATAGQDLDHARVGVKLVVAVAVVVVAVVNVRKPATALAHAAGALAVLNVAVAVFW